MHLDCHTNDMAQSVIDERFWCIADLPRLVTGLFMVAGEQRNVRL
jgi:hypothetical protein